MTGPNSPTPPNGGPPAGGPPRPPKPPIGGPASTPPPKKGKRKRRVQAVLLSVVGIFLIGFAMLWVAYSRIEIPKPNDSALAQTTRVLYADEKEPEIGRFGDTNRSIVGLDRIPVTLRDAVLAAENR